MRDWNPDIPPPPTPEDIATKIIPYEGLKQFQEGDRVTLPDIATKIIPYEGLKLSKAAWAFLISWALQLK